MKTDELIITNERIWHIKDHHPQDFDLFEEYGYLTAHDPDLVLKDGKSENTIFMIRHLEKTNLNVVVKLILEKEDSNHKNSVMTFFRLRDRNLKKLEARNKTLYKKK